MLLCRVGECWFPDGASYQGEWKDGVVRKIERIDTTCPLGVQHNQRHKENGDIKYSVVW